jgi:hypothetical protein
MTTSETILTHQSPLSRQTKDVDTVNILAQSYDVAPETQHETSCVPAEYRAEVRSLTQSLGGHSQSPQPVTSSEPKYALELLRKNALVFRNTARNVYDDPRGCNKGQNDYRTIKHDTLTAVRSFVNMKGANRNYQWAQAFVAYHASGCQLNTRDNTYRIYNGSEWREGLTRSRLITDFERLIGIPYTGGARETDRWINLSYQGGAYDPVQLYLWQLIYGQEGSEQESWEPSAEDFAWWSSLAALYLGVDTPLAQAQFSAWLVAAVMRATEPGCKHDYTLVLKGGQGARKTTLFEVLGGKYFQTLEGAETRDNTTRLIKSSWIVEASEIDGILRKKDVAALKTFLTLRTDSIIRKYEEDETKYPRACVFAGSTNESSFLNDSTGSRRFWVINVPREHIIDTDRLTAERDRIWRMAAWMYMHGHTSMLSAEQEKLSQENNKQYEVENPVSDLLSDAIQRLEHISSEAIALVPTALLSKANSIPGVKATAVSVRANMEALGFEKRRIANSYGGRSQAYVRKQSSAPYFVVGVSEMARVG